MIIDTVFRIKCMALLLVLIGCVEDAQIEDVEMVQGVDIENEVAVTVSRAACREKGLELVRLGGKVRHFGLDILQSPPEPYLLVGIPDVRVWVAEYPFTKQLDLRTDENGEWEMFVIKRKDAVLNLSFMYEKDHHTPEVEQLIFPDGLPEGWDRALIKSNVHRVASSDITDIAMQMPDELFLYYAKTQLENGIGDMIGASYAIENLVVATVGKSWASIYDPTLPHGDPEAQVVVTPALSTPLSGPIYFDETVTPNPTITATSVDGGVLVNNLTPGAYTMTAVKDPFEYDEIEFIVDPDVRLYVASPPHAIQGSNESGPGEV